MSNTFHNRKHDLMDVVVLLVWHVHSGKETEPKQIW